jgi:hypothetical protein
MTRVGSHIAFVRNQDPIMVNHKNDLRGFWTMGDDLESDSELDFMLVHMGKVSQSLNTRQNEWTVGLRVWWYALC